MLYFSVQEHPLNTHIKKLLSENPALSIFLDAIREFGGIIEPQELFEHVLNVCIKIFKAEGGSVMLFTREKEELTIKSSEGLKADIVKKAKVNYGESIAGWVAQELEPLLIIGENKDPRFTSMKEKTRVIKDSIVAPICVGNRVFGVISLNNRIDGFFTEKDKELLTVVATIAAIAIERMELMSKQQQSIEDTEIITNVSKTLGRSLDTGEVYRTICDFLKQYMDFSVFALFFMDEKTIRYTPIEPIADSLIDDIKMHFTNFFNSHTSEKISPDELTVLLESDLPPLKSLESLHIGSFIDMPLSAPQSQDKVFGDIYIASVRMDAFKETDMKIFSIVAEQAAIAISNARLYTALKKEYEEASKKLQKLKKVIGETESS